MISLVIMTEVSGKPNKEIAPIRSMDPWEFWARPDSFKGLSPEEAAAIQDLTASAETMHKAEICALAAKNWLIILPMETEGRRPS